MEKILDFNDRLGKIVSFLNIIRDITPIINTYSAPFTKVKTELASILEKLKNPDDIIINTPSGSDNMNELVRKKQILEENQEVVQLLDSLSKEIKGSSDFILKKYSKYFPNMVEEKIPDFRSTISSLISAAPSEMLTTEGRSGAQLAALERRKTHLDPRDIAKFYKDMIINVFNQ